MDDRRRKAAIGQLELDSGHRLEFWNHRDDSWPHFVIACEKDAEEGPHVNSHQLVLPQRAAKWLHEQLCEYLQGEGRIAKKGRDSTVGQVARGTHSTPEESHVERLRRSIEDQYLEHPTGCGGSFGEILCYEIHEAGLTFCWLAEKWGVSLAMLGELIADHCRRLETLPRVDHGYDRPSES